MVEVFKTNVADPADANRLIVLLQHYYPYSKISFDLEDCDNILRIEEEQLSVYLVMEVLMNNGYQCCVLD